MNEDVDLKILKTLHSVPLRVASPRFPCQWETAIGCGVTKRQKVPSEISSPPTQTNHFLVSGVSFPHLCRSSFTTSLPSEITDVSARQEGSVRKPERTTDTRPGGSLSKQQLQPYRLPNAQRQTDGHEPVSRT